MLCAFAIFFASAAFAADKALLDGHASYPEGPLFAGNTLYVAEMGADRVSAYEHGKKSTFFKSAGCGPTALAPYRNGFLILCHIGGELVAVDKAGKEIQRFGKGVLRDPNDGYADPMGGVYFSDPGVFSKDTRPEGLVYRLTPEGKLDRVESGLWYPNGVYVDNAEKSVYVSETFARKVWRYAMGADGKLSGKTLFADIDAIAPKTKYSYREGKLVGEIRTPSQYETNIAFGAPGAVVVGAYDNANLPLPGEVRWWKRAR